MTRRSKILAAMLAAGIALPAGAFAQDEGGRNDGPRHERGEGKHRHDREGDRKHHRRDDGPRRGGPGMMWKVAEKLAAAETALGITPEQEPAWRNLSSAVVAFVQAGRGAAPPPPPEAAEDADAAPAGEEVDSGLDDLRGVQRLERFLDRAVARGEAAARVKTALDGLSATLTPEQARIADELLSELAPRNGPRRGPGHGGPRGPAAPEAQDGETPPPPPPQQ